MPGWSILRLDSKPGRQEADRVYTTDLPGGYRIAVGDDLDRTEALDAGIVRGFVLAFAASWNAENPPAGVLRDAAVGCLVGALLFRGLHTIFFLTVRNHVVVVSGNMNLPWGFRVSALWRDQRAWTRQSIRMSGQPTKTPRRRGTPTS